MAERLRNREMTSYFAAVGINVDDTGQLRAPSLPSEPTLCDDAVLNALAQTGALRLQCDLAFVSLIGQKWQYIIAEASASLPYRRAQLRPSDRMCMGFTAIPSEMAICLNTLKCFTDPTGRFSIDDGNTEADATRYRIRDLRADDMFCARPYVTGWPHIRAYLEVPLKTCTGLVIGSYCVIDRNLRDDFGDSAMPVMTEVAQNIMDHLELLKVKQQCERAERLVRGLSVFVAGCSSLHDLPRDGSDHTPPYAVPLADGALSVDSSQSPAREPSPGSSDTPGRTDVFSTGSGLATPLSSIPDVDPLDLRGDPLDPAPAPPSPSPPAAPHDAKMAFARAANLIREATSIEGIVFLDACPTGFGALHTTSSRHPSRDASAPPTNIEAGPMCEILGSSTGPRTAPITGSFKVPEPLLQRLLRNNSRGRLIYADANGPISPWTKATDDLRYNIKRSMFEQQASRNDIEQLLSIVPQACSVLFLPLWDYTKGTWYAAAVGWTTDPSRSFEETDMTYISAFSNSVMAEVARLDALVTSTAKGDFISSISHEFRSPLHGIMATTELLEDVSHDPDQRQLTGMIRSCASTLIDTTNHLLDFAKINKLVRKGPSQQSRPHMGRTPSSEQSVLDHGSDGNMTLSSVVDLARLVEEVVEGAFIGNVSQTAINSRDGLAAAPTVLVTVDIEKRDGWSLRTEPGAWRRIVMNIFGNALKYTARGTVAVSLKTIQSDSRRTDICFSVTDTGCGMSADYLKRQLFTPYSQANSLSAGVGLGLSIVQHLVKELGGTVHVESTLGVGTMMKVTVPTTDTGGLINAPDKAPTDPDDEAIKVLRGKSVAALELGASASTLSPSQTLLPAFTAMAKTWLGVDVLATDEVQWMRDRRAAHVPLIVLCKSTPDANEKQKALLQNATLLVQPFGPRKLAWTVARAFTRHSGRESNTAPSGPLARTEKSGGGRRTDEGDPSKPTDLAQSVGNLSIAPTLPVNSSKAIKPTHRNASPPPPPMKAPTKAPAKTTTPPTTTATEARRPHVLAVDDNGVNLKILTTSMAKMNCTFETATNGLEAVQAFKAATARPFDYVFMDISMPIMDGFEATRAIRAHEQSRPPLAAFPRALVVALTGLGATSSQKEAFSSGVDIYLTKPVPLKKLKELVLGTGKAGDVR
ncbi:Peroxide stress-activated histidine kinase mak2 [Diplodia seriata]|uniref:histidine kinase n=1 Tax=Diplodia seriata TaxID=420778 RepID=A0A1S8BM24_9PEZI|nr:Peroxide stress-activated histidine kinase mak2 [Diplodia seriata]